MANILSSAHELLENSSKKALFFIGSSTICCAFVGWKFYLHQKHKQYVAACAKIGQKRDEQVANLNCKIQALHLDEDKVFAITKLPLKKLAEKLKSRELLPSDVLHAYQKVALDVHERTNCLTTVFEEAEDWAKALEADKDHDGILYGVPISIKDNIPTKGHINSRGCLRLTGSVCDDDALLVKVLKSEGAIPFVKTNVPQLLMGVETSNALYGRTCNPHDLSRTCGGSSGGEAALIAGGGSVIGIGSDIGGSVRIPASHCGICALKPTSDRISLRGSVPYGQTIIKSCWGPMARDVDSLVMVMKAVLTEQMFCADKSTPPISFDDQMFLSEKPLTIGYYVDDGLYPASPPMSRAVIITKKILEARGHKLVPWTPPDIGFVIEAIARSYSGDRGCLFRSFIGNEQGDESINRLIQAFTMPDWLRYILVRLTKRQGEEGLSRSLAGLRGVSSVSAWFDWTTQTKLYTQKFDTDWQQHGLDAVICPSFHISAPKLGYTTKMPFVHTAYPGLYNFVDYAAGVVPVTKVCQEDIEALPQFVLSGPRATCEFVAQDIVDAVGLPITVQCVAPAWREELCLRLLKEIEAGALAK